MLGEIFVRRGGIFLALTDEDSLDFEAAALSRSRVLDSGICEMPLPSPVYCFVPMRESLLVSCLYMSA